MTLADPVSAGTTAEPATAILLDIPETTEALRCGRSTVYELIAAGELTTIKIGRRRLVTRDSLVKFIERSIETK